MGSISSPIRNNDQPPKVFVHCSRPGGKQVAIMITNFCSSRRPWILRSKRNKPQVERFGDLWIEKKTLKSNELIPKMTGHPCLKPFRYIFQGNHLFWYLLDFGGYPLPRMQSARLVTNNKGLVVGFILVVTSQHPGWRVDPRCNQTNSATLKNAKKTRIQKKNKKTLSV